MGTPTDNATTATATPPPRLLVPTVAIALAAALGVTGLFIGGCSIYLVGLVAVVWGTARAWRKGATTRGMRAAPALRRLRWLSVLLAIGYVPLLLAALGAMRECGGMRPVSAANLRGLGQGIAIYCRDQLDFPPQLATLVNADICPAKQCINPRSSDEESLPGQPLTSSYVYRPGSGAFRTDPALIIAYEREILWRTHASYFAPLGRLVLFADGRIECLTDDAFRAALTADERRRAEIGWPTAEPEPGFVELPRKQDRP